MKFKEEFEKERELRELGDRILEARWTVIQSFDDIIVELLAKEVKRQNKTKRFAKLTLVPLALIGFNSLMGDVLDAAFAVDSDSFNLEEGSVVPEEDESVDTKEDKNSDEDVKEPFEDALKNEVGTIIESAVICVTDFTKLTYNPALRLKMRRRKKEVLESLETFRALAKQLDPVDLGSALTRFRSIKKEEFIKALKYLIMQPDGNCFTDDFVKGSGAFASTITV